MNDLEEKLIKLVERLRSERTLALGYANRTYIVGDTSQIAHRARVEALQMVVDDLEELLGDA